MTSLEPDQRLDLLILARIAGSSASKRPRPSDVRRSMIRCTGTDLAPGEARREIDARFDELARRGLLTRRPLDTTERGRQWLCHQLGVREPPSWTSVQERVVPLLALGLEPASSAAGHATARSEYMQATVLARLYDLDLTRPTLASVVNALIARRLGTAIPTATIVRPALVRRWVAGGMPASQDPAGQPRSSPDPGSAREPHGSASDGRAPTIGTGARGGGPGSGPRAIAPPPDREPTILSDEEFAAAVSRAARQPGVERLGDRKVCISVIHRDLTEHDARFDGMTFDTFAGRLVEANRQRLLTLARADFVAAMDLAEVQRSHIHHLGSDFHFVVAEAAG
jgi:hypothetical protein